MKYCDKCGNHLFDEAILCVKCGNVIDEKKFNEQLNIDKQKIDNQIIKNEHKSEKQNVKKKQSQENFVPFIFGLIALVSSIICVVSSVYTLSSYYFLAEFCYAGGLNFVGWVALGISLTDMVRHKNKSIINILGAVFGALSIIIQFTYILFVY